jgi:hypothetical protein
MFGRSPLTSAFDAVKNTDICRFFFFFFLVAFPLSPYLAYQVPLRSACFFSFFPVVRRGSGVLSPATHAHPLSSPFSGRHNTNTTHNIHGRPIRPGIRTLLTSRWCRKSVALPSTTLPSAPDRHTHTSMARRRFLPSKKSSPFGGIRTTSAGTATSEHCLRQPCGRRATYRHLSFVRGLKIGHTMRRTINPPCASSVGGCS